MTIGFILMKVTPAYEYEVYNKLLKVPEVIGVYSLFEEYDIIAKIEAKDFEKLGEVVVSKIRSIEGVYEKTVRGIKNCVNEGFFVNIAIPLQQNTTTRRFLRLWISVKSLALTGLWRITLSP